jgi:hypothetical protein
MYKPTLKAATVTSHIRLEITNDKGTYPVEILHAEGAF